MKTKELRNLTTDELKHKFLSLKQELFELRASLYTTKLEKPHKIRQTRKDIARISTILKEKDRQDVKTQ